ncbi:MAG: glycosyltransferase family 2 protein, partial [Candidatus Electrothrix sp. MAN1_4]|nr:glycosyltransferase family 2 protein [Candidatus Electrothrix sp. MAN1_4]
YNREFCIEQAIKSVREQSYNNLEIIVIDDCSTDETYLKLLEFGNTIKIIHHEKNKGAAAARNTGIKAANGDIITFLDSDDLWMPEKVEKQVLILNKVGDDVPCCLCNTIIKETNGKEEYFFDIYSLLSNIKEGLCLNILYMVATRFVMLPQAIAIRREAIGILGGFNETIKFNEDHELSLRLATLGAWAYTNEPLVIWNKGSENSIEKQSLLNKQQLSKDNYYIYSQFIKNNNLPFFVKSILNYKVFIMYLYSHLIPYNGMGRFVTCCDRLVMGLFRRSPLYPQMKTIPITQKINKVG